VRPLIRAYVLGAGCWLLVTRCWLLVVGSFKSKIYNLKSKIAELVAGSRKENGEGRAVGIED